MVYRPSTTSGTRSKQPVDIPTAIGYDHVMPATTHDFYGVSIHAGDLVRRIQSLPQGRVLGLIGSYHAEVRWTRDLIGRPIDMVETVVARDLAVIVEVG